VSGPSSIEWCDATWNPVRGCSRVSEGCRNCYAERQAARFSKPGLSMGGLAVQTPAGPRWTGDVELIPSALDWPLRKRKTLRIFVNSMSDLFHEKLSNEAIAAVFGVMAASPQHTFQILTKRPERMRRWFQAMVALPGMVPDAEVSGCILALLRVWAPRTQPKAIMEAGRNVGPGHAPRWPLPNVWLGTSVENQATADERIPHLLATPAAKRFVSYEPALGPVDFRKWINGYALRNAGVTIYTSSHEKPAPGPFGEWTRLDWIIVGGESGPGARPFDVAWARSTVEQCRAAGVPVFVKQLGAKPFSDEDRISHRGAQHPKSLGFHRFLNDRKGGDWIEWPEDLRVREFPTNAASNPGGLKP
jgi:protein gp37